MSVRKGDLADLIFELGKKIVYLREDGMDIRNKISALHEPLFVLGDHQGLTEAEENTLIAHEHEIISVGPLSLHADHCIVLLHNEMDRADIINY